jgi:hypothetical protein
MPSSGAKRTGSGSRPEEQRAGERRKLTAWDLEADRRTGADRRQQMLGVRFSADELRAFHDYARSRRTTVSQIVRLAVLRLIARPPR